MARREWHTPTISATRASLRGSTGAGNGVIARDAVPRARPTAHVRHAPCPRLDVPFRHGFGGLYMPSRRRIFMNVWTVSRFSQVALMWDTMRGTSFSTVLGHTFGL